MPVPLDRCKPCTGCRVRYSPRHFFSWIVVLSVVVALCCLPAGAEVVDQLPPQPLTADEFLHVEAAEFPPEPLRSKLLRLLTTPFVSNAAEAGGVAPLKPELAGLGKSLRVVLWNVEGGLQYDAIEAVLQGSVKFASFLDAQQYPAGSPERARILQMVDKMRQADVITLNEADWGMPRTGYRHVADELASALQMNYAFGIEFIYHRPLLRDDGNDPAALGTVDRERYKGLHGNAILSRYPLENVRIISLGTFEGGKTDESLLLGEDDLMRVDGSRRGGRIALAADIVDAEIPGGRATIITTHLDARVKSRHRRQQLEVLLAHVKGIGHPVVLTGDLNTAAVDATPISAWRVVRERAQSRTFWLMRGLSYVTGLGPLVDAMQASIRFGRTQSDPTVTSIPLIAPNPEEKLFERLADFRFDDGGAFDFRGDAGRSAGGFTGTLANSNERSGKGFVATFRLKHRIGSLGKFKLDWIFVKPATLTNPTDSEQPHKFAPHFGRTLHDVNNSINGRMADHDPLMVDLPFDEPPMR